MNSKNIKSVSELQKYRFIQQIKELPFGEKAILFGFSSTR